MLARVRLRKLINRDKSSLDIFWLRGASLEESDNVADPAVRPGNRRPSTRLARDDPEPGPMATP
jgi:hypothetical protein